MRATQEAGYTLVEMLVALALLSLLSLAIVSGLRFGAQAWQIGGAQSRVLREVSVAQSVLRREIGHAYPLLDTSDIAHPHILFEGDESNLQFLAQDPMATGLGRSQLRLQLVPVSGATAFAVTAIPELANDGEKPTTTILVHGVTHLTFAYYGADTPLTPPSWHAAWRNQKMMPMLVRVQLTFADGDTQSWPDLTITPVIDADVGCSFDPLTKSCRGR